MSHSPDLLREQAYRHLKRAIVTGEYETNSVLYESSVSKTLGMSRTPIRDAFVRLTEDGLVKNLPNHGYLITAITVKEIEEIFDLRLCLEKYVIELAIDNDIPIDLAEMEKCIKRQEEALEKRDYWTSFEANHDFHISFISIIDNGTLKNIMRGLNEKPIQSGYRSLRRGANLSEAIAEHKEIVAALKSQNKKNIISALKQHVTGARKRTLGIYL